MDKFISNLKYQVYPANDDIKAYFPTVERQLSEMIFGNTRDSKTKSMLVLFGKKCVHKYMLQEDIILKGVKT